MEHAANKVLRIPFYDSNHLVLCLPAMNHQWQLHVDRPTHLLLKGLQLFVFKLTAPIVVETYLADGEEFES